MSANFKPGDRVYLTGDPVADVIDSVATTIVLKRNYGVHDSTNIVRAREAAIVSPAPQPEREAVAEPSGHVIRPVCHRCNDTGKVFHAAKDPLIMASRIENCSCRGPEVKPSPAPTPEAAAEVTAGERAHNAYNATLSCPPRWACAPTICKLGWEAAAQAVLASQPATATKGDREVVGWVVRVALANDDACWNETQGWVERRYATLYSSSASARDSKPMNEMRNGRIVTVTRRRGAR